jgi:DNA-directed RNA polymerase beta' subunit
MKKILLVCALGSCTLINARQEASADAIVAFIKMEKVHKEDWFNFAKKKNDNKFDLLVKHHDEMADAQVQHIMAMGTAVSIEDAMATKLQDMIALHEAQVQEWKAMCDADRSEATTIYNKHKTELTAFKATHPAKITSSMPLTSAQPQSIKAPQWSNK